MLEQLEDMMIPQSENASLQSISREVDLAWLAGIIDGEGNIQYCVKTAKNGKDYFMPKVRISNTDIRMVKKISEIYKAENIVFFYTINKRKKYNAKWKDQLHIEIASQGSTKKILKLVMPYLINKKDLAFKMINIINFVQDQPRGGNFVSSNYVNSDEFKKRSEEYEYERLFYIDPSTTTRRASEIVTW